MKQPTMRRLSPGVILPPVITGILITAAAVIFHQSPLRILPLYVSLIVVMMQSQVNRWGILLGGINALLYGAVYVYYGLYGSAMHAVLVSSPLQIIAFFRWRRNAYKQSTLLRRMTWRARLCVGAGFALVWAALYIALSALNSSYRLLDNTLTLLSTLVTVLTMLAYVEYSELALPNCLISVILYVTMLKDKPEQAAFLISSLYSLYCNTRGFINVHRLYAEQQRLKQTSGKPEEPGGTFSA